MGVMDVHNVYIYIYSVRVRVCFLIVYGYTSVDSG